MLFHDTKEKSLLQINIYLNILKTYLCLLNTNFYKYLLCTSNPHGQEHDYSSMQTHFREHPVFGLHYPLTRTHSHTRSLCHNVTQAGTKVNYRNFRGKLFYALTACGSNRGFSKCVCVHGARHALILLSAAIFRLQLLLRPLHMRWCECIPDAPLVPHIPNSITICEGFQSLLFLGGRHSKILERVTTELAAILLVDQINLETI